MEIKKKSNIYKIFSKGIIYTILSKLVTIPFGIIIAKLIGSEGYGVYAIAILISQYLSYGNLGIFNGLTREVPISKGNSNKGQRKEIYNAVFSFLLISSLVISLIFLLLSSRNFLPFDSMDIYIAVFVILIFLSGNIEGFLYNSLKGENRLSDWTLFVSIRPVIESIMSLILVYFFNLYGLIISVVLARIISSFLLFMSYKGTAIRFTLSNDIFRLIGTGLPIMISNFLKTTLTKAPILFTAGLLAPKELGAIAYAINNLGLSEKLPTGSLFALANRNEIARKLYSEENKNNLIIQTLKNETFYSHIVFSGIYGGLLALFYYAIIDVFLSDYSSGISSLIFIASFYFIQAIFNYLVQTLDILRYLMAKLLVFISGIIIFLSLIFSNYFNIGLYEIAAIYLFAGLIASNSLFFIITSKSKNFYVFLSCIKLNLIFVLYFISLYLTQIFYSYISNLLSFESYIGMVISLGSSAFLFVIIFLIGSFIIYPDFMIKIMRKLNNSLIGNEGSK